MALQDVGHTWWFELVEWGVAWILCALLSQGASRCSYPSVCLGFEPDPPWFSYPRSKDVDISWFHSISQPSSDIFHQGWDLNYLVLNSESHQTAFKACVTSAVFVISTQAYRDSHQPQSIWFAKNLGDCPLNISTSRANCLHQTTTTKSQTFQKDMYFFHAYIAKKDSFTSKSSSLVQPKRMGCSPFAEVTWDPCRAIWGPWLLHIWRHAASPESGS